MAPRVRGDCWDMWNFDHREPVSEYDPDGCMMLLAAVVRRWWLDGLWQRSLLKDLADWMEVDVQTLLDTRPVKFYAERRTIFLED